MQVNTIDNSTGSKHTVSEGAPTEHSGGVTLLLLLLPIRPRLFFNAIKLHNISKYSKETIMHITGVLPLKKSTCLFIEQVTALHDQNKRETEKKGLVLWP